MGVSGRPVDKATKERIQKLAREGFSRREIMRVAGVARRTVDKYAGPEKEALQSRPLSRDSHPR
jgi:hypothetical protein